MEKIIEDYLVEEGIIEQTTNEIFQTISSENPEIQGALASYFDNWYDLSIEERYNQMAQKINGIYLYDMFKSKNKKGLSKILEKIINEKYVDYGDYVLDIGCATGLESVLFSKIIEEKGFVSGIDVSPKMIQAAKERSSKKNIENIEFLINDMNNYHNSRNYDSIICLNDVLTEGFDFYSEDNNNEGLIKKTFKNFKAILNPDGKIFLSLSYENSQNKIKSILFSCAKSAGFKNIEHEKISYRDSDNIRKTILCVGLRD